MELIKKKYNNIDIYFPTHSIFEQMYKISFIQKIRKNYEEKNKFKYDIIIRTRPDLCILDNDYYIYDGPYESYKKGGIYYEKLQKQSYLFKNNIKTISSLLELLNTDNIINFSLIDKDLISINSNYAANKEIDIFNSLLFVYDNIYNNIWINYIIEYLNSKYSNTQYYHEYDDYKYEYIIPISKYSSNDYYINNMLLDFNFNGRPLLKFLFLPSHCFCNEIEIISRMLLDKNITFIPIHYFIATRYFYGLKPLNN
jgi:hypothetical protein